MHKRSGIMKIYSSRKIIFPSGVALRKYDFSWENWSSYFPHNHAINALKKYPRIKIHVKTNDTWFNLSQYLRYSGFSRIDDKNQLVYQAILTNRLKDDRPIKKIIWTHAKHLFQKQNLIKIGFKKHARQNRNINH